MTNKIRGVSIKVHPLFFDNVFEKGRKQLENRLKVKVSQIKYSEYMAKNMKVKIDRPKLRRRFI